MLPSLALLAASIVNPLTTPNTFPIAVWLQEPSSAKQYKSAGFNLFVGLWEGPTEAQLTDLAKAGMPVICEQNAVGLKHSNDPVIVGWMHQDEPDNAQPVKGADGKDGWGPCVPPESVVAKYRVLKSKDPSRPVLLNLGQGVANDHWIGRGNGSKLDDYRTYVNGCDIVSFDVYPVAGLEDPESISLIGKGLDRLVVWTNGKRRIWNCLECTAISGKSKASPAQVRCEAWLSIVHGSRGFIYFVHQFAPRFDEHALLDDPSMLDAVTKLNAAIQNLSPALPATAVPTVDDAGIHWLSWQTKGDVHRIGVNPHGKPVVDDWQGGRSGVTDVVDENRSLKSSGGRLSDAFGPFGVHIYKSHRG